MTKTFKVPFATQGDRTSIPDEVQADGAVSYAQGYGYDYERDQVSDPAAKDIEREKMNGIFHDITEAVGEVQNYGFPKWAEEGKPYPIRAIVYHKNKVWQSKVENNEVEPVAGAQWAELKADLTAGDINVYNKTESDKRFQPLGNYQAAGYSYSKAESNTNYQPKGNYAPAANYAMKGDSYTKAEGDGRYQPKGSYQPAGNYAVKGESYTKSEEDGRFQPKGNYAPAGNYASADYFAQIGTYSMMESPNHKYRLVIHDDGRVSAHDNINGNAIFGFTSQGEMNTGSVPASRVTGLVVNELGQSTTQVISQKTATNSFALSELFGSGFTDSWMKTPNKKNFIQILDSGTINIVSDGNYNFTISPQGEITNGSINATRVTGLFSECTDVTSQRSRGTTYTNPNNKPLFVSISFGNTNGDLIATVNGAIVYSTSNTSGGVARMSAFFIVPPRGTYKVESPAGFNLWSECA